MKTASGSVSGDPLRADMLEKHESGNRVALQTIRRTHSAESDGDSRDDSVVDSCSKRAPSNEPMSRDKRTTAEITTSRTKGIFGFGCGFGT